MGDGGVDADATTTTKTVRGADIVIAHLHAAGVRHIFSLSGNQIMPLYDACFGSGIEIIHTRHEAAAVYMAEAYAQITGRVGVALVTAGAGAANAMGALFSARQSHTPVLLLSGDSPVSGDGRGTFQEFHQVPMSAPVTRLSMRATHSEDLSALMACACLVAQGATPGPVHLVLPVDLLEQSCAAPAAPPPEHDKAGHFDPTAKEVAELVRLIDDAQHPVIIGGPSLNHTRAPGLLNELQQALDLPAFAMESPRGLRDPALGGVAQVLHEADLVVCLGKPVDFTLGFGSEDMAAAGCRWIVVDADDAERTRAKVNLGGRLAAASPASPIGMARALIKTGSHATRRDTWRTHVGAQLRARPFGVREATSQGGAITPAQLCAAVQRQIEHHEDSIIICDGGEFGQWAQAAISGARRVVNGVSGVIGGGLPYAIGARKAAPDAVIFTLMGDGTVGFHLSEFETAARANAAFVAVIGNDGRWNAEHQIQMRSYGPDRLIGCDLSDARYDLAVEALGGHGEFVTDFDDLDAALARALASGKPACVNVRIQGDPAPSGAGH